LNNKFPPHADPELFRNFADGTEGQIHRACFSFSSLPGLFASLVISLLIFPAQMPYKINRAVKLLKAIETTPANARSNLVDGGNNHRCLSFP
jgi:hypothetical protein